MSSVVVMLDARRPKSPFLQLVAAGYPRSQACRLADYVRERSEKFGESRQHAVDRLVNMPHRDAPTGAA